MYVRTLYLSALEEAVTVTKWPFGAVVTRADGRIQPGPAKVPVDFDLFLFRRPSSPGGAGTYVWASQSTEDNNEGFDFKADVAGDYDVYLTWPEGSTNCTSGTSVRVARSGIVF